MSSTTFVFVGITFLVIAVVMIITTIILMRQKLRSRLEKNIFELEAEKNKIISPSLLSELNKAEGLINNDVLKSKYNKWKAQYKQLKEKDLSQTNDKLIEAEGNIQNKNYKDVFKLLTSAEMDIYHLKAKTTSLLDDIKSITMSEERNRNAITKLKVIYREILQKYNTNHNDYKEIEKPITLQFENIDKLFSAFEKAVDNNELDELGKIVKALDDLINNMQVVIDESPTILFMGKVVINKKINEVTNIYKRMTKDGYNLEYLNIDYNIEEANKNLEEIFDKLNVLNLEDSIFELKTMHDYFESLFSDFEKEKIGKQLYEDTIKSITSKLARLTKVIKNIYIELGDLKDSYALTDEEIAVIDGINKELLEIKDNFKLLSDRTLTKVTPYSNLSNDCELLSIKLAKIEDKLDATLRNLSSLKEDELRAREQLVEIKALLRKSKARIKEYKLPVITKNYYIELNEALFAIKEVVKELDKKPISIKVLNTRVDTARDLVLKVYSTANEMVKTAAMAEMAVIYGNRYKSNVKEVSIGIEKAEKDFYKGNYKTSLETIINALNIVEPGIHKKLLSVYKG